MVTERAAFMRKLRLGVSYVVHRKLALGLCSWRFAIEQQRAQQAQRGKMSRALIYMMQCGQSRGWSAWHAAWVELVAKRASLRRGLAHMLNRGLSRGWGAWVEM